MFLLGPEWEKANTPEKEKKKSYFTRVKNLKVALWCVLSWRS